LIDLLPSDATACGSTAAVAVAERSVKGRCVWMWRTALARRSVRGNLGCLLHPATRRATGVRRSTARFRAWWAVAD